MEYIDIFLTSNNADVMAVNEELAKGDEGDAEIINQFYSQPVAVLNPAGQVVFWHILVTREQYDARKAANKPTLTFKNIPPAWKRDDGSPFRVFGSSIHLPSEEIEEEIEEPVE